MRVTIVTRVTRVTSITSVISLARLTHGRSVINVASVTCMMNERNDLVFSKPVLVIFMSIANHPYNKTLYGATYLFDLVMLCKVIFNLMI